MKIYADINDKNEIIGFYQDDIHKNIPATSVLITEEIRQQYLSNQGKYILVDGQLVDAPPKEPGPPPPKTEIELLQESTAKSSADLQAFMDYFFTKFPE